MLSLQPMAHCSLCNNCINRALLITHNHILHGGWGARGGGWGGGGGGGGESVGSKGSE